MQLERAVGRNPIDRREDPAFPADIESLPRIIEVKAFATNSRGYDLSLETRQVMAARHDPDFYVYVVENTRQGDPTLFTLKVLSGERLRQLLAAAREVRYFSVPWPPEDYDSTPGFESLVAQEEP